MENFDELPFYDKVFSVIKHGAFLGSIDYYNQKVDLYHVNGLYVELFYHPVTAKIAHIQLAEPKRLHLYSPMNLKEE